jgi:hypothetical protein
MPTLRTLRVIERILQERARGRGLPLKDIRKAYPAGKVRRETIAEILRFLEEHGLVRGVRTLDGDVRYRWTGPMADDADPFGVNMRRINRDLTMTPVERLERLARMHEEMPRTEA